MGVDGSRLEDIVERRRLLIDVQRREVKEEKPDRKRCAQEHRISRPMLRGRRQLTLGRERGGDGVVQRDVG